MHVSDRIAIIVCMQSSIYRQCNTRLEEIPTTASTKFLVADSIRAQKKKEVRFTFREIARVSVQPV